MSNVALERKIRMPRIINRKHVPLIATFSVCLLLYIAAGIKYPGILSAGVFVNLLGDNAFLGIAAIGATFVILSGGIDLSVGAVIGCSSILVAVFVSRWHMNPALAVVMVLCLGTLLGSGMGALIRYFGLPPFLVTLAGMFLARGIGFVTSMESVALNHPLLVFASKMSIPLGDRVSLSISAIVLLAVLVIALYVSLFTRFGRRVYAIGGSETSSLLMGLPAGSTKVWVYALGGFCSALAGVVYTLYTLSGNASAGVGLEMDAIAAVVIGGTLLSGGVGHVAGTFLGLLILGLIQTMITFQGTLSSWWTRIAIGMLLLAFVLIQRFIQNRAQGGPQTADH